MGLGLGLGLWVRARVWVRVRVRVRLHTLPIGTVVVAMSSWKLSPAAPGTKQQIGLVPTWSGLG